MVLTICTDNLREHSNEAKNFDLNIHNLWEIFTSIDLKDYEVFLINEGQFFSDFYDIV